ncbi:MULTISPECIES: CHAT domain-containing protein [unclassified Bradyrhizobium]|uniref:CHAT domain-containing protein n=1 Tax=unclassified Bradyrhizobium TaxID=2631580 RepID=UPI0023AFCD30|nr:CHAT domain-containing protein [Bradyrhizobium sp. CSS354]MDE5465428.1 CHAT domain-containing protein [Bradyrhizobium sp. CSS354]
MQSLWLRVEQLDEQNGRVALFDVAFPPQGHEPIIANDFPLGKVREQGWTDREQQMAFAVGAQIGLFEDFGHELRSLLDASVLARWEEKRVAETRTYLEVVRPSDALRQGGTQLLADLPWEYLAEKKQGGAIYRYFADRQKPMLRVLTGGGSAPGPLPRQLNTIVITGEAIDWKIGGFPGDDAGAVLREFQRSEIFAHAELLQTPSLPALGAVFDRLNPEIVHFTGHGELSPTTGRPALKINTPGIGQAWWWDTAGIYQFFFDRVHKPRLVVLNACDSAQPSGSLYSLLEMLMTSGIPAVVAAQAPIQQAVTSELSQIFYQELLARKTVDVALMKARVQIGQRSNGAGWESRDWGLPVLCVSIPPEELFPEPTQQHDPIAVLHRCAVLKRFMRSDRLPAPFVGLGWADQRWKALEWLRTSNCLVIKGPHNGGKSWLVMRTLRDAIQIGHRVKYVEVCGGRTISVNYLDVLSAIVDADTTQVGSEVHAALDGDAFKEFVAERDANSSVERIMDAFERGLRQVTREQELTIVLDEFQREAAAVETLPAKEFTTILLPLWMKIAQGSIKNLRLIIALRQDLFEQYELARLPGEPIELQLFNQNDVPMLFQELCRFYRKPDLDTIRQVALIRIKNEPWDASEFRLWGQLVEKEVVP